MKKHLATLLVTLALVSPAAAQTINNLGAGAAVQGTDMYPTYQGANPAKRVTAANIYAYIQTNWGTNVAAFLATPSSANLRAALPDETGTGAAVFGTAPTISSLNATTAMTLAFLTGSTQCVQVNASGVVSGTGVACGGAPGGSSGQTQYNNAGAFGGYTMSGDATIVASTGVLTLKNTGPGATGPIGSASAVPIVTIDAQGRVTALSSATIAPTATPSVQTGSNYAFQGTDQGKVIYLSNAANQVPTIAQAGTGSFTNGWYVQVCNINAGTQTITPTTSNIGGAASYVIPAGSDAAPKCAVIISDGTNYRIYVDGAPLNGANTWTGTQTFGPVVGSVSTQSGTTYTFASTDCGTTVRFSNGSAVTATIPQGLPIGCNIAVLQAGAGQVSVNGSAVTPATLQSAHSYTKTFGAGAVIGLFNDATNHVILTGDGAT